MSCYKCKGSGRYIVGNRSLGPCFACRDVTAVSPEKWDSFVETHPTWANWILSKPNLPFAVSLKEAVMRFGRLTAKQGEAIDRAIDRQEAYLDNKMLFDARIAAIDCSKIIEAFSHASPRLKRPKLTIGDFVISPAPSTSKNRGSIYVKARAASEEGEIEIRYLGKVTPDGRFHPNCNTFEEEAFRAITEDPLGEALRHGKLSGRCAVCSRSLTHEDSVGRGIGPVCAENFGWMVT